MFLSARRVQGRDVDHPPLFDRRQQDVRDRSEPRARARRAQTPRYVHAHFNRRHHRVVAPSRPLARRRWARAPLVRVVGLCLVPRAVARPSRDARGEMDARDATKRARVIFYHRSRATHRAKALLDDRLTAGIHRSPPSRSRAGEDLDAGPDGAALRRDPRPQRQASGRNHG